MMHPLTFPITFFPLLVSSEGRSVICAWDIEIGNYFCRFHCKRQFWEYLDERVRKRITIAIDWRCGRIRISGIPGWLSKQGERGFSARNGWLQVIAECLYQVGPWAGPETSVSPGLRCTEQYLATA